MSTDIEFDAWQRNHFASIMAHMRAAGNNDPVLSGMIQSAIKGAWLAARTAIPQAPADPDDSSMPIDMSQAKRWIVQLRARVESLLATINATPQAPTPAAEEGQAEAEISCDQCIELAEELQKEWMRKAIAETRTAASLFDVGGFRAGMETACDEIETRMALDGDTAPTSEPVAWAVESNLGTGVRAFVKLCTEEGEADRFAARHQAAYAGAERVKVPLYRATPLPRQAAVQSDTDRMDFVAKSGVRGSTYKGITSINVIVHEDDLLCGGARYAIDCMIEHDSATPTAKAGQ